MNWLPASFVELADLVWPARCAGCGERGTSWCQDCVDELAGGGFPGGPAAVRPTPAPPGMPPAYAWGPYRGLVRTLLVAYKDRDRRDLARVLAPLLTPALAAAGGRAGFGRPDAPPCPAHDPRRCRSPGNPMLVVPVLVVPVPSNSAAVRQRGDRPLEALGRSATALLAADPVAQRVALTWAPCLRVVRGVGDQAGLDRHARAANLAGAFAVRAAWREAVRDAACVVVDDVVTTGATLAEATRALRAAGAGSVTAATIAATARRPGCSPLAT